MIHHPHFYKSLQFSLRRSGQGAKVVAVLAHAHTESGTQRRGGSVAALLGQ
jgi:hypothetical protein